MSDPDHIKGALILGRLTGLERQDLVDHFKNKPIKGVSQAELERCLDDVYRIPEAELGAAFEAMDDADTPDAVRGLARHRAD